MKAIFLDLPWPLRYSPQLKANNHQSYSSQNHSSQSWVHPKCSNLSFPIWPLAAARRQSRQVVHSSRKTVVRKKRSLLMSLTNFFSDVRRMTEIIVYSLSTVVGRNNIITLSLSQTLLPCGSATIISVCSWSTGPRDAWELVFRLSLRRRVLRRCWAATHSPLLSSLTARSE